MRMEKVTINYSADKLQAIRVLKPEVYETLESVLVDCLEKIYTRAVPQTTRKYIEARIIDEEPPQKKPPKNDEKMTE